MVPEKPMKIKKYGCKNSQNHAFLTPSSSPGNGTSKWRHYAENGWRLTAENSQYVCKPERQKDLGASGASGVTKFLEDQTRYTRENFALLKQQSGK